MKTPTVTVALLIYKSPEWLRWCLERLAAARNDTPYNALVVGNDANTRVTEWVNRLGIGSFEATIENQPRVPDDAAPQLLYARRRFELSAGLEIEFEYVDHRNPDPSEYAMARVYRAWNRCVAEAKTEDVVLVNSDMAFGDGWLDELLDLRRRFPKTLPTSLLVESGRLPSGLPDEVRDFGRTPATFLPRRFAEHAAALRAGPRDHFSGGLFMPVLWRKADFERIGGYWIQTPDHVLASDAVTFNRAAAELGLEHRTAARSVVYHVQLGESWDEP